MLRQYETVKDPDKTVTLLEAVQQTRVSWHNTLPLLLFKGGFWKSTLILKPEDAKPQEATERNTDQEDISKLTAQIATLPGIQ